MNAQLKPMDNGLSPLRVGRITGSRVAAVLGLNPYNSRDDVLREMVRESCGAEREFIGNVMTLWGQDHEPAALALYEKQNKLMTYGGGELIRHPLYDFLAVTPDGLVGEAGMIECKAPYRGKYTTIAEVPYYMPQVQLQMACARRWWTDFVVWRNGEISVDRVMCNPDWVTENLGALQAFMGDFADAMKNPEPHLEGKDREDSDWHFAASMYLVACREVDRAEKSKEAVRKALLALAGDASAKGCGVNVIRSERAGSVAYAQALKAIAPDADLTPYTGKPSVVFSIKETK